MASKTITPDKLTNVREIEEWVVAIRNPRRAAEFAYQHAAHVPEIGTLLRIPAERQAELQTGIAQHDIPRDCYMHLNYYAAMTAPFNWLVGLGRGLAHLHYQDAGHAITDYAAAHYEPVGFNMQRWHHGEPTPKAPYWVSGNMGQGTTLRTEAYACHTRKELDEVHTSMVEMGHHTFIRRYEREVFKPAGIVNNRPYMLYEAKRTRINRIDALRQLLLVNPNIVAVPLRTHTADSTILFTLGHINNDKFTNITSMVQYVFRRYVGEDTPFYFRTRNAGNIAITAYCVPYEDRKDLLNDARENLRLLAVMLDSVLLFGGNFTTARMV